VNLKKNAHQATEGTLDGKLLSHYCVFFSFRQNGTPSVKKFNQFKNQIRVLICFFVVYPKGLFHSPCLPHFPPAYPYQKDDRALHGTLRINKFCFILCTKNSVSNRSASIDSLVFI
jgi:hypothetical protein